MRVIPSLEAASDGTLAGTAMCIGNFDGVHLGHQALFERAAGLGQAVALTFWPHPGKVLQPHLAPRLITTLPRRLELLDATGLVATVVQPFTDGFAALSAPAFEALLLDRVRVAHVVVGADFTYGQRRTGSVATLARAAGERGARVEVVDPVAVDGVVVSSSRVREYVLEGRVDAARRLLGRPFELAGPVVRGEGRGRTIGFPTANVACENELMPAVGVYAAVARLAGGREVSAAVNVGVKPTFGAGQSVSVEAHLVGVDQDLYGQPLRLGLTAWIRGEQRFAGVDSLVAQIRRDVEAAVTATSTLAPGG